MHQSREVRELKMETLGSFSNDDGDGYENVKTATGLLNETSSLRVHDAFLYISLPLLHDYDVKMPNFTFYGGRKRATGKFSCLFLNLSRSPRNQRQGNLPTLDIFNELELTR